MGTEVAHLVSSGAIMKAGEHLVATGNADIGLEDFTGILALDGLINIKITK